MYFASVEPPTGKLIQLEMTPIQIKYFKVNGASTEDAPCLADVLNREGKRLGRSME